MVDGLEKEMGEDGRVVRVDARDKDSILVRNMNFKFTPTFVFLDAEGNELWRTVGKGPGKAKVLNYIRQAH